MRLHPLIPVLMMAPLLAQGPEIRTTAKDRTALSVTIYQNGIAAIRDTRRVNLPAGPSRLAFADLVPSLRPKSATLLDPGGGIQVLERNYEFNLLSPASLVDASLGLPVRIKGKDGKADQVGTLASVPLLHPTLRRDAKPLERLARKASAYTQPMDPNVVVTTEDGLRTSAPSHLAFTQLPSQLRASPTLLQDVRADTPGPRNLTLIYTATDLTWSAHYVATLDTDGKHLDLDVFATLKNGSLSELLEATLQLMAGIPNVIYDPPPSAPNAITLDQTTVAVMASALSPPTFKEEKLSELPLFTLDRPVNIRGHSEKQLALMKVERIPFSHRFLIESPYEDYQDQSASSFTESGVFQTEPSGLGFSPVPLRIRMNFSENELSHEDLSPLLKQFECQAWLSRRHPPVRRIGFFQNRKEARLGRALPSGSLVIRYRDPLGSDIILSSAMGTSDSFPQTPPGEEIELVLGPARGFRLDRRGVDRKVIPEESLHVDQGKIQVQRQRRWEYEIQIQIASDLAKAAEITVREPLMSGWELLSSTHPGTRTGQHAYDFQVKVPARGYAILRYRVLTTPEPLTP